MQRGTILPARVLGSPRAHTLIVRQRLTLRTSLGLCLSSPFSVRLSAHFPLFPFSNMGSQQCLSQSALRYCDVWLLCAVSLRRRDGLAVYRYSRWFCYAALYRSNAAMGFKCPPAQSGSEPGLLCALGQRGKSMPRQVSVGGLY